jgi:hypothetical protein
VRDKNRGERKKKKKRERKKKSVAAVDFLNIN